MLDFLQDTSTRVVLGVGGLVILLLVAFYVVRRLRGHTGEDESVTHEVITNFQEMHDEGDISDDEYRKLKTVLDRNLRRELNDTGDKG